MLTAPDHIELALLVAVAETGSLGQAAARHGLSQPAVSMRMSALERRLGLQLLVRDATGTRLTPVGEEIVAAARRVLEASDELIALAEHHRAASVSRLRVAASFTVAEHLLPAWIGVLQVEAPEVSFALEVLNTSRVIAAVRDRQVDVGFIEGVGRELPGLSAETLTMDELVTVVSPAHPWARRDAPLDAAELAASELVVRERGSGTREVLDSALSPLGGTRCRLELGSSEAVLAAARRNEGPAVLSALAAADALERGEVVRVAVAGLDLSRPLRAVWRSDLGLGPLARRLLAAARGLTPT